MSECGVCLEIKPDNQFKILSCNHNLCEKCYPQLRVNKCPFCRTPFIRETNIIQPSHTINVEINFFEYEAFLPRRQIRRQRNKNNSRNRGRPRVITNNNPISIFFYDGDINIEINDDGENKQKNKKNDYKRNKKNNRWSNLRNQQNFNII